MDATFEFSILDDDGNPGIIKVPCELNMPVMHTTSVVDGHILEIKHIKSMSIKIN